MKLIDLRGFHYEINKIVSFDNNELIFGNTEFEEGVYKRYFYKYAIDSSSPTKINSKGINTCENARYNTYKTRDYIYTNAYEVKQKEVVTSIYRINLLDGITEKLYSISKDVEVIIIDSQYVIFRGTDYEIDEEHLDVEKDINGEYDYAILCDLKDVIEYPIKDRRVILGIRDHFIPYEIDNKTYIVLEEAYMEDWELEEAFDKGIKKEDFCREGYRDSINIISVDQFAQSIKSELTTIEFSQISKTELSAWARYFGMDDKNIYFRVKDFETKVEEIYRIDKRTLEKQLISSMLWKKENIEYYSYDIWYDIKNRKIYEIKSIDGKEKEIKELFDGDFIYRLDNISEDFGGVIGEHIITWFWTEDEDGENYREFVRIRHTYNESEVTYEGNYSIISENVILFK